MPKATSIALTRTSSIGTAASEIPFVRRRLLPEQLTVLQAVFETNTHPSKEERIALATELGMALKSVNVWYQNKRRSVKKQSLVWKPAKDAEREQSTPSKPSSSLPSNGPPFSLDCVATSRELKDSPLRTLRPPLTPKSNRSTTRSPPPTTPRRLWEHIPSSPSAPPSSPSADSMRLSSFPSRSKPLRSLEWACAKERAGRKRSLPSEDAEVPDLDTSLFSDHGEETEVETDEAITPNTSLQAITANIRTPSRLRRVLRHSDLSEDSEEGDSELPAEDVEAAIALLGFKVRK